MRRVKLFAETGGHFNVLEERVNLWLQKTQNSIKLHSISIAQSGRMDSNATIMVVYEPREKR